MGMVRTARSAQRVSLGNYLPYVASTGVVIRSNQSTTTATTGGLSPIQDAYGTGLTASIPLYTGGFRRAVRHETAALTLAADAGLVLERFAIRLLAKEGYFEVLRGHELVRVGRDAVSVAKQSLRYARTREQAGTATPADVLQSELQLTTTQRQLLAARDTLYSAAAMLGRLVGVDGLVDADALRHFDPTPLPMTDSAIVVMAVRDAPAVRQAVAQVAATAAAVRAARAQYAPSFSAAAGYIWSNNVFVPSALRRGWNVALGASWPIFTGFQREDSLTRADVSSDVAGVTAADTRRLSGAEARQLLGNLHVAEQDVELSEESVQVARENLRVITVRYRAGIATILDQLTAQEFVIQAELNLVSARFTYQVARASLEALLGRDLET
jgi:outer membrane protein TolC